jgi:hypothetical protein
MVTSSGTVPTYDEYTALLLSAALAYDDQFIATKSKCHVKLHKFQHDEAFL